MSHVDQLTDLVRERVRQVFEAHGACGSAPLREAMLIREGWFCGRRFECDGLQAVWFVEENQLKVYGREGRVSEVVSLQRVPHQAGLNAA